MLSEIFSLSDWLALNGNRKHLLCPSETFCVTSLLTYLPVDAQPQQNLQPTNQTKSKDFIAELLLELITSSTIPF